MAHTHARRRNTRGKETHFLFLDLFIIRIAFNEVRCMIKKGGSSSGGNAQPKGKGQQQQHSKSNLHCVNAANHSHIVLQSVRCQRHKSWLFITSSAIIYALTFINDANKANNQLNDSAGLPSSRVLSCLSRLDLKSSKREIQKITVFWRLDNTVLCIISK